MLEATLLALGSAVLARGLEPARQDERRAVPHRVGPVPRRRRPHPAGAARDRLSRLVGVAVPRHLELVHVVYILALVRAYHHGDFSSRTRSLAVAARCSRRSVASCSCPTTCRRCRGSRSPSSSAGSRRSCAPRRSRCAALGGAHGRDDRHLHDARHRGRPQVRAASGTASRSCSAAALGDHLSYGAVRGAVRRFTRFAARRLAPRTRSAASRRRSPTRWSWPASARPGRLRRVAPGVVGGARRRGRLAAAPRAPGPGPARLGAGGRRGAGAARGVTGPTEACTKATVA